VAEPLLDQPLTLNVTGMTCGGCENAVTRALSKVDGVQDAAASHRDGVVTVRYDPTKTNPDALKKKIAILGYEVTA